MASLDGESPTTPHSTASPTTITTQPGLSDPNWRSPLSERSPQDVNPPTAPTGANGHHPPPLLNPRSCTTCRKRKVRCDKRRPCANCSKANIECIFPGPGRAPRRSRKPPDTELLARLRRLEGVVQSLGKGLEDDGGSIEASGTDMEPFKPPGFAEDDASSKSCPPSNEDGIFGLHTANREHQDSEKIFKEFGRLTVEGGRSRYVSNKFWVSLSEEVAEMRDILDDPTDDEDDYPSPGSGSGASANHQGYIFGFSSIAQSLRNFHPPAAQICNYWKIFKENVDPLIKIFHRPSTEKVVTAAAKSLDHLSKPMEAMMFSIYFAAITSLSEAESVRLLGIEKQVALETYRFGFEQAMARADFLSTQELVVLQSFVLFLTCVRRFDDSRYAWTLTGLVIRMAQALGVHRDGQIFGLSPFETEMRRRLWWQICNLDMRASEDHGSDPSIVEQTFDTKFPLNINDDDIWPGMIEPPEEKEGRTEMLFDLIRFTVSTTVRRLSYAPPGPGPCRERNARITLEDKERLIEELHQYLEKKYLRYCNMNIPLDWVAATVSRLILAKMWLIVHHPFQREDGGAGLPQETKDRLFLTSIEVIEFSCLLETETTTLKWGWLFRTYVQWHAVAFVLSQLCVRTNGPEVEKAWAAVDSVFDEWGGVVSASKRGMLWKPLRKLMARARAARQRELEKQCRFPLDDSLGPSSVPVTNISGVPPPSLGPNGLNGLNGLNGSTNNTMNVNHNHSSSVVAAAPAGFSSPSSLPPPPLTTSSNDSSSTSSQPLDIYRNRQQGGPNGTTGRLNIQTGLPLVSGINTIKNELVPLDDWSSYTDGLLPTTTTTADSIFGGGTGAGARVGGATDMNGGGAGKLGDEGGAGAGVGVGAGWVDEGGAGTGAGSLGWGEDGGTGASSGGGVAGWEDGMDWVGWDFMVQDFRMEVENGQGVERGARGGGMINWW